MAICYDCIHRDVCRDAYTISNCECFKNKADFVEVKHGRWIYETIYYSCSICAGKRFNLLLGTDAEFCPYCGAKMDAKKDGV